MTERSEAENAGRGVLFIAGAKVYFMLAGFAIEFALTRLLGPFLYGAYGIVVQWVSNINNVVVTGTIQAVSRYTTADPERVRDVQAAGIRMHLLVGLPLAVLYAATSPFWAWLIHDPGKAGLMALSAVIVAVYAFYTVFIGAANGTRAFHKQAALDMTAATLRAGGIIAAAALGLGVWGAISAWVAAAIAVLCVAVVVVGAPRDLRAGAATVAPMTRFLGSLVVYLALMNLLMSADQLLLKPLSTGRFLDAGLDALEAARQADGQVGYYRAVQTLARLPYQLMIAVTFVVFPLVSRSTFEADAEKTRGYIHTTLRYSLIFAGLMGAVLASNPTAIMHLPFTAAYATVGGPALALLALGNVAFAVFSIAGAILNGAGRTLDSALTAAGVLAALAVGLWIGVPRAEPGSHLLTVCAATTSAAMLLGAAVSGLILWRRFGAFLPLWTFLRVALAIAAAIAVGRLVGSRGALLTLAGMLGSAAAFVGALVATRELGGADLRVVARVLRRRR